MSDIDLNDLYKQTKEKGIIEDFDTNSGDVDLEALYSETKKIGLIEEQKQVSPELAQKPQVFANPVTNLGMQAAQAYLGARQGLVSGVERLLGQTPGMNQQVPINLPLSAINQALPTMPIKVGETTPAKSGGELAGMAMDELATLGIGGLYKGLSRANPSRLLEPISNVINSGKNIKRTEEELIALSKLPSESAINKGTAQAKRVLKQVETSLVGQETEASKQAVASLTDEFKRDYAYIQNRLKQASTIETSDYKGAIKNTFNKVNDTYGKGIDAAENAMIQRGDSLSKAEYIDSVANKTLQDAQARGIPENDPSLKPIKDLIAKLETGVDAQETLGINEAKNVKNGIYGALSGGVKRGVSPISESSDQVANIFLRNHAELLGQKSPELAILNKEAAPMYEARRWAYSKFKPYRPMEIEKGANILEKVATGGKINADDVNYLRTLEQGSGRFQGTGNLRGNTSKIGEELKISEKTFNESKQRLIDASDYRIKQIEDSIKADKAKIGSGAQEQLALTREASTKEVELKFKMKELEKLRAIKWALISMAGGTALFGGKPVVGLVKKVISE